MAENKKRIGLLRAYQGAGIDFLAYRLRLIFCHISTPEDIALHNDAVDEILTMVDSNAELAKGISMTILYEQKFKGKNFLRKVAGKVLELAGKDESKNG